MPFDPTSSAAPVQPKVLPTAPLAKAKVDPDAEVRAVLLKAADIIERDGWCSMQIGDHYQGPNPRCMMNSISAAGVPTHYGFERVLGFDTVHDAYRWNGTPGRTKAEVIARLRSAARG